MAAARSLKRFIAALLGAGAAWSVRAMTVVVQASTVFAGGPVGDDVPRFEAALSQPGIETVVFVNSPGGDLWTGMRVGRLIAGKGLQTVAAGFCVSACSIMFMGGRERSFADTFRPNQTFVGIHGAHRTDTRNVDPQLQPQIYAFLKDQMGERFNSTLINKALYDMEDAGSLLRVFDATRLPKRSPYHCRSEQTPRKDCTDFADLDALGLGVVTRNGFTPVDLPEAFKQAQYVLGQTLTVALADPAAYYETLSEQQCTNDRCRGLIADFDSKVEHKALAIPVGASGLGFVSNRDSAASAFVGALYACNHVADKPARLCETQTTDGFDVRGLYAAGVASHAAALARLKPPADVYYANEEFGGGMTSAKGLRTNRLHDITPLTIEGLRTFGTQELARALSSAQAPVLVDVWAGVNDAIPSAVTLLFGGLAFDDAQAERAYEARFLGLLQLLSPDPARPLVFYAQSRDYWQAANAAMRARKLGYAQVGWYRGGFESWQAAGLPLARVVVRAVVR